MANGKVIFGFMREKKGEESPLVADGRGEREEWLSRKESEGELAVDVYQTEDEVIVVSTVAGVLAEDLEVTVSGDLVTIRGERRPGAELPQGSYLYQECFWGPFSRSIVLPVEVKSEGVSAQIKNGILTVHLPKLKREKIRVIPIADKNGT